MRGSAVLVSRLGFLPLLLFSMAAGQTVRDLRPERITEAPKLPDGRTRWALVIGISKYKNVPPAAQLEFADDDAEDVARFLRTPQGGSLSAMQMRVLTNENATLAAIRGALHTWLPRAAGPNDVVYLFIAGHGVLGEQNKGYFVAHDSDPQNLHATGLSFDEVNDTLNNRVRAGLIVLMADACHAGGIGWASNPATPSRAQSALESIGRSDRSFLKILASRPSERSFEDRRWDGGHGVFTFALLRGLRGGAEIERDGVVRATELVEYISKVVPEQTGSAQNPRVAGNFEPRLPLATTSLPAGPQGGGATNLTLRGPAGSNVYIDEQFRGAIRPSGDLSIAALAPGFHRLSVDVPREGSFDQQINLTGGAATLDIGTSPAWSLARLDGMVRRGRVMETGGAWDLYRTTTWTEQQKPMADALIGSGLENTAQECVGDYVQSTSGGLKRAMLLRSAEAFARMQKFRPNDRSLVMKEKFCLARAQIAAGEFAEAVENLQASLAIDSDFACAYNALGVAYGRLGRPKEARAAFEKATQLTPEWSLPFLQIAQNLVNAGEMQEAIPYLEKAVKYNPLSIQSRWWLLRGYRLAGRAADFEKQARDTIALDPNYAPTYLEIGNFYEGRRDFARAAQAFDTYLILAPNFADSAQVRARATRFKEQSGRKAPTLRR